jgi:hypothetical protein
MENTSVLRRYLGGFAGALVIIGSLTLGAQTQPAPGIQERRPLAPRPPEGLRVAPFFDGFYANDDGSATLSFGYSNPNRDEVVEIPLGPDNFIEPKEFDGRQPTSFPPIIPEGPEGAAARSDRRERERGVFTVTVPAGFKGDVVWTLRNRGQVYKVPARTRTGAYMLRWPMAMGSIPPLLRFKDGGPAGRGPAGITSDPVSASVNQPLPITVWVHDDSKREPDPLPPSAKAKERPAMNVRWFKHSGPGPVEFEKARQPINELQGMASTQATFKQPGEYVVRVKVDNFGRLDTSAGNQCCWTNGYLRVTVK